MSDSRGPAAMDGLVALLGSAQAVINAEGLLCGSTAAGLVLRVCRAAASMGKITVSDTERPRRCLALVRKGLDGM